MYHTKQPSFFESAKYFHLHTVFRYFQHFYRPLQQKSNTPPPKIEYPFLFFPPYSTLNLFPSNAFENRLLNNVRPCTLFNDTFFSQKTCSCFVSPPSVAVLKRRGLSVCFGRCPYILKRLDPPVICLRIQLLQSAVFSTLLHQFRIAAAFGDISVFDN